MSHHCLKRADISHIIYRPRLSRFLLELCPIPRAFRAFHHSDDAPKWNNALGRSSQLSTKLIQPRVA
jgi:hypothetical protein